MDSLERPTRMSVSERAELADITFGGANLTPEEYSANILRLAESKAAECESCEINWLNFLLAASDYRSGREPADLGTISDYYGAQRICAEELYLHFYGGSVSDS